MFITQYKEKKTNYGKIEGKLKPIEVYWRAINQWQNNGDYGYNYLITGIFITQID